MRPAILVASALVACSAVLASAQAPGRVATTTAALRASPVFFHGKQIAVLGSVVESRDLFRLEPQGAAAAPAAEPDLTSKPIYLYWRERPTPIRGRNSRRVLGSRPAHRRRHAILIRRFPSAPRSPHAGTMAGARPGVRHPEREPHRGHAAPGADAAGDCAGTGAIRESQREHLGPLPRPEPPR